MAARTLPSIFIAACVVAIGLSGSALAVAHGSGARAYPTQESQALEALSFLTGCWAEAGDGTREQFTPPTENLILGTSRRVVGGRVAGFEFHAVTLADGVPTLTPYPGGVRSDPFPAATLEDGFVVWENREHDFPQRIIYDGRKEGLLIAAIEGDEDGRTRRLEFRMRRVPCVGPGSG